MNLVYDFDADARFEHIEIVADNTLMLYSGTSSEKALGGSAKVYVFDFAKKAPVVLANGISSSLYPAYDLPYGLYAVVERPTISASPVLKIYNSYGKVLFECLYSEDDTSFSYEVLSSNFIGEPALLRINGSYYILK